MAQQKGGRKVGRNKRKPTNAAYAAEGRKLKNKKRRAARQQKIEAKHEAKRFKVRAKRKAGAVRRLERRIAAGATGLADTLAKAKAAAMSVGGAS